MHFEASASGSLRVGAGEGGGSIGGGSTGGSDDSEHGVSVQARADVQLIGWQNTWEQAPGVPATPSPP